MVGGDSDQTVGASRPGDLDTRSATTDVEMPAVARDARCDVPAGVDFDPVVAPARPPPRPPAVHRVAKDDGLAAKADQRPSTERVSTTHCVTAPSISTGSATAAESVPASAPESEVVDMTTDSGYDYEGGAWATVACRKRKLNVVGRVATPLLDSPALFPLGRLQIVEISPVGKLIPKKMCLPDSGSDSD